MRETGEEVCEDCEIEGESTMSSCIMIGSQRAVSREKTRPEPERVSENEVEEV